MLAFLPITTPSTQAPTTTPATSVPRSDPKRVDDKAEPPASGNDLENRLSSLLAGNKRVSVESMLEKEVKYFTLTLSLLLKVPGDTS